MENFLLLIDDLDDAVASIRLLWPQIAGFLLALGLFSATIAAFMTAPLVACGGLMVIAAVRSLSGLRPLPALRTDP